MNRVVLDANIFVKLFKAEPDSDTAIQLLSKLVSEKVEIVEPSIVVNETITTCEVNHQPLEHVVDFFTSLLASSIRLVELDVELIQQTFNITQSGHEKSGYPTFSDSVYHAVAIREQALFVTADRRHYEKTRQLGHITLLENLSLSG